MTNKQFDKELTELYQQRKNTIKPPQVKLGEDKKHSSATWWKPLSVVSLGGVASFAILAIVSQLAPQPKNIPSPVETTRTIELKVPVTEQKTKDSIVIVKKLPEKPSLTVIEKPRIDKQVTPSVINPIEITPIEVNLEPLVTIARVEMPTLAITPVHKVMPKYTAKALQNKDSGEIRLSYQINEQGEVININVVESSVGRELQRAAKKALAKWQYALTEANNQNFEVVFQFDLGV